MQIICKGESSLDNVDINQTLTPILARKIVDCISFNKSESAILENMDFELTDLGITYSDMSRVCVSDVWYSYDYLGLSNNHINGRIGCNDISLYGIDGITVNNGINDYKLFNSYLGKTNFSFCGCADKIRFIEQNLQFEVKNLVINVKGTIGGEPFIGTYSHSGTLV